MSEQTALLIQMAVFLGSVAGCVMIARDKHMNVWLALTVGVLFGVFGLIFYAVVFRPKPPRREPWEPDQAYIQDVMMSQTWPPRPDHRS